MSNTITPTVSLVLAYSSVEAAKTWWIEAFDCSVAKAPPDWDNLCLPM